MKLVMLGLALAAIGALLMIVRVFMGEAFPEPLRYIAAGGLLAGTISSIWLLHHVRKNSKMNNDQG